MSLKLKLKLKLSSGVVEKWQVWEMLDWTGLDWAGLDWTGLGRLVGTAGLPGESVPRFIPMPLPRGLRSESYADSRGSGPPMTYAMPD
jgi:hypothetical protein